MPKKEGKPQDPNTEKHSTVYEELNNELIVDLTADLISSLKVLEGAEYEELVWMFDQAKVFRAFLGDIDDSMAIAELRRVYDLEGSEAKEFTEVMLMLSRLSRVPNALGYSNVKQALASVNASPSSDPPSKAVLAVLGMLRNW